MEQRTVYFDQPGPENTDAVLRLAHKRAQELGIDTILVASTTGETAVKAMDILSGFRVIIVTHAHGFREPDTQEFNAANREAVESQGGIILTVTHAFGGLSRAMRLKHKTVALGDIIANTLRVLGQGTKVACEIALMAADAGLVRTDQDVIAVGGSSQGADTALLLQPKNAQRFFDLRVKEIICKPHF